MIGIGQYIWTADKDFPRWSMPNGAVNSIDIRPLPLQAQAGGEAGWGLFFGENLDCEIIGATLDDILSIAHKDLMESILGTRPEGDTIGRCIFSILTDCADPIGDLAPKPLIPYRNSLEVHLGKTYKESFRWGTHKHTNKLKATLRDIYSSIHARGGNLHRKFLDDLTLQYNVDWKEFVPPSLLSGHPGPMPRETTISDNFNGSDAAALGIQLTWTEQGGTTEWSNLSNLANKLNSGSATDDRLARAESDLSSTNHYGQAAVVTLVKPSSGPPATTNEAGVTCRHSSSAATCYFAYITNPKTNSPGFNTAKMVTGTITLIRGPITYTVSLPHTLQIRASGSTISGYLDTVLQVDSTDTSITTGTRCGLYGNIVTSSNDVQLDDFTASDLTVALVGIASVGSRSISSFAANRTIGSSSIIRSLSSLDSLAIMEIGSECIVGSRGIITFLASQTLGMNASIYDDASEIVAYLTKSVDVHTEFSSRSQISSVISNGIGVTSNLNSMSSIESLFVLQIGTECIVGTKSVLENMTSQMIGVNISILSLSDVLANLSLSGPVVDTSLFKFFSTLKSSIIRSSNVSGN